MTERRLEVFTSLFLVLYLLVLGVGAAIGLVVNFPADPIKGNAMAGGSELIFWGFTGSASPAQRMILLATLAGITGSFLHAAQSLSTYIGNSCFKVSWTVWYVMRPLIGGVLGLAIYFAIRAGLVAGATEVNPYGVVSLGLLGGWFSKTTTDKLQEVFETLFKTEADQDRKDKLGQLAQPTIEKIYPSPLPNDAREFLILGNHFDKGIAARVGTTDLKIQRLSSTALKATVQDGDLPKNTPSIRVDVTNIQGNKPSSEEFEIPMRQQ